MSSLGTTQLRLLAVLVSLGIVALATAILWALKVSGVQVEHAIFYYLVPAACVAVAFGSVKAMLFAVLATACATFFLYEPLYSFYVSNTLEVGELICFVVLALIGAKCVGELRRPRKPLR
jgi:K+-sensing histidine kinase KdpD